MARDLGIVPIYNAAENWPQIDVRYNSLQGERGAGGRNRLPAIDLVGRSLECRYSSLLIAAMAMAMPTPPDDQGNNYPGGFNVYTSPDGVKWNISARLGAVTADPNSINATGFVTELFRHYAVENDGFSLNMSTIGDRS